MADLLHLNLWNGIAPLALLLALTFAIPAILAQGTLSQARLAGVVLVTGLVVCGAGALIMAGLYAQVNGGDVPGVWPALQRSARFGLLWGPVLALVWLMRAQGVERRKGLLMGRDQG